LRILHLIFLTDLLRIKRAL